MSVEGRIMKIRNMLLALACCPGLSAAGADMHGHMEGDPLLAKVMINRIEVHGAEGADPMRWDIEGWLGRDLHKLWLKSEGEYIDGTTEEAELQLLYDHAVAPYWDVTAGWRTDFKPEPGRNWFALGLMGVAPYFIGVDSTLFVGNEGRAALRVKAEYKLPITQRLILSPELEVNVYSRDDSAVGVGSGLSDLQAGLRLRYEFVRQLAPYVGIEYGKKFGDTADFARSGNNEPDDVRLLAGVRAWY